MSTKTKKKIWLTLTVIGLIGLAASFSGDSIPGMIITTVWTVVFGSLYFRISKKLAREQL